MREAGFVAAIAVAAVVLVVAAIFASSGDDCTSRGGHVELDHFMLVGKVLVPIDKCVGAR